MGSVATERRTKSAGGGLSGLTGAEWVDVYRLMYLSRRLDDREILLEKSTEDLLPDLRRRPRGADGGGGQGAEAGLRLVLSLLPRPRALPALGVTPEEMLLQAVGAAADPASGGRQMPSHWGNQRLNIVTQSSSVATQMLQAVGCAEAGRYLAEASERGGAPGAMTTAPSTS